MHKVDKLHLVAYETPGPGLLPETDGIVNGYLAIDFGPVAVEVETFVGDWDGLDGKAINSEDWDVLGRAMAELVAVNGVALTPSGIEQVIDRVMTQVEQAGGALRGVQQRQRKKIERRIHKDARSLLASALAQAVQRRAAADGGTGGAESGARAVELFHRAGRSLMLPEGTPPTYVYQPDGSDEKSAPLLPNAFDDTGRMVPLGTMDAKSHLLERECVRQGFDILRVGKGVFTASKGEHRMHFKLSRSPLVSVDAISLCTHKEATREFLAPLGFPVPRGRLFRTGDYDNACSFAGLIGYPVVLKPATGVRGIGVVPGIQNQTQLRAAFKVLETSKLGHDDFIIEKHVFGADYRIMVIGGKVYAATLRAPASVMGDGEKTIAELILTKNAYRQRIPHLKSRPVVYTDATQYQLEKVGYDLSSIPKKGETVVLSGSCNLSQGGDSVNVLEEMHPSILKVAEDAVKAIPGLHYCGIDFLIGDHRKPASETDIGICELNAHAAIGTACYPMFGAPVNVPRAAVEEMVKRMALEPEEKSEQQLAVRLRIRGKVTGVSFRKWFYRHATRSGLKGYVKNLNPRCVEAVVEGHLVGITALATACIRGPSKALPTSVQTTHANWHGYEEFSIQ